jgi:hypothetical protein
MTARDSVSYCAIVYHSCPFIVCSGKCVVSIVSSGALLLMINTITWDAVVSTLHEQRIDLIDWAVFMTFLMFTAMLNCYCLIWMAKYVYIWQHTLIVAILSTIVFILFRNPRRFDTLTSWTPLSLRCLCQSLDCLHFLVDINTNQIWQMHLMHHSEICPLISTEAL